MSNRLGVFSLVLFVAISSTRADSSALKLAYFRADASPPVGSPLAYNPTGEVLMPLTARGVVLLGSQRPIVLCAIDWIGIGNVAHVEWRTMLAEAAQTTPDRVAVHTLHQHDAPACDFTAEALLAEHGLAGRQYDNHFARQTMSRVAEAIRESLREPQQVTHLGLGAGKVDKIASNRRVIGADGMIKYWRGSSTEDPAIRAEPEGVIDPLVRSISFFHNETALLVLCYYATHPMSYYRTGQANPDFVGIARSMRETELGVPHIYFTGAGGNVAAGKYNDGSHENRQIFADRLASGMNRAWEATKKTPLSAEEVKWSATSVALPVAENLVESEIVRVLQDERAQQQSRFGAARNLVWLRRCRAGDTVALSCLHLGNASILHLCGELFIEYQLAAQQQRPDRFVAVAAYGDYGPGYIGTKVSYPQGGYEVGRGVSRVAPEVEGVLTLAIRQLLTE